MCVLRFVYSGNAKTLELTQNNTFTHTQHFYKKNYNTGAANLSIVFYLFVFFLLKKNLRNINLHVA